MKKTTRKPRALPWAKCLLALQAVVIALCLTSCASTNESIIVKNKITKKLPPLDDSTRVMVYDVGDTVPERSEILSELSIWPIKKRREPTLLEWDTLLETAQKKARTIGGNGLEVLWRAHVLDSLANYYEIIAYILNINDSIQPTVPKAFDKMDFHDYIITKEGDTVPCHMLAEYNQHLVLIRGYNREGYRKGIALPISDVLSYQIENHKAMEKEVEDYLINKYNSFKIMLAVDGGWCFSPTEYTENHSGFYGTGEMLFNIKNGVTLGVHYSRSNIKGIKQRTPNKEYHYHDKVHYVAGSIGIVIPTRHILEFLLDGSGGLSKRSTMLSYKFLLGYLSYVEESKMDILYGSWPPEDIKNYILTKEGLGFGFHVGIDRMLTKHLGIEIGDGLFFERPLKATIIQGESAIPEEAMKSHFHFTYTLGLRYYL